MPVRNAELAIGARRSFARHQKREHARQVSLEGHRDHVGHQLEMLGKVRRHPVGLGHARVDLRIVLLGALDLPLNVADRRQVFIQLAAVRRAKVGLQFAGILGREIQNAAAELDRKSVV